MPFEGHKPMTLMRIILGTTIGIILEIIYGYMSDGLNLGWGGPIGDYIGFGGGPIKGYTTSRIQGSYRVINPKP